jgi:hypothetical protein
MWLVQASRLKFCMDFSSESVHFAAHCNILVLYGERFLLLPAQLRVGVLPPVGLPQLMMRHTVVTVLTYRELNPSAASEIRDYGKLLAVQAPHTPRG